MIKNIFIGVDGGGTKSKVRVEDDKGNLLSQATGGPANIRLSVEKSWQSILNALNEALDKAKINLKDNNYHFHLGAGLAGCEIPEACKEFVKKQHPFKTLYLKSDAYAACVGAHDGKDGSIIIIGTGVVGFQIQAGKQIKISGWGFPHDDEGGGAWIGLEAIRLTLQWIDKRMDPNSSILPKNIFQKFDNDLTKLVVWSNEAKSTQFAEIAPFVIDALKLKDPLAINIIKKAAKAVNEIGQAFLKFSNKPLPCSLFGGISPFIEPWLEDNLKSKLVPRKHDATFGAILMVKKELLELNRGCYIIQ